MNQSFEVIAIGGANIDIKAKAERALVPASSNPGAVSFALGGVARNVAHNLARLDVAVALISAVGADAFGRDLLARTETAGVDMLDGSSDARSRPAATWPSSTPMAR